MRWISQDWLTNAGMAGLLRVGGAWGPTLLSLAFALLVGASFWILWRAAGLRSPRVGWLARTAWLSLGLIVAGPIVGVRVQTVDLHTCLASAAYRLVTSSGDAHAEG